MKPKEIQAWAVVDRETKEIERLPMGFIFSQESEAQFMIDKYLPWGHYSCVKVTIKPV
jgi:hypothetical protein